MAQSSVENPFRVKIEKISNPKHGSVHTFRPIYIVSRLFGQMPFSIACTVNGKIDRPIVNILDGVWFVVSVSVYVYDICRSLGLLIICQKCTWELLFVGKMFLYTIVRVLGLLAIILDMCYRFRFIDIFKKIIIFDKRVSSNFYVFIYKQFHGICQSKVTTLLI